MGGASPNFRVNIEDYFFIDSKLSEKFRSIYLIIPFGPREKGQGQLCQITEMY